MLLVRLVRGDLAKESASVLVTSANDALVGNRQPLYWRFTSRVNVDGAIRQAAGPELADACLAFEEIKPSTAGPRRDIMRWEQAAKRGESSVLRCRPGEAVSTRAFGALDADHVVHAVAPDSEFMYEGYFQGLPDGYVQDTVSTVPLDVLESTYRASFRRATDVLGATSMAMPSLGSGVKGWRPLISSCIALKALVRHFYDEKRNDNVERRLTFVLGDDAAWVAWRRAFTTFLGETSLSEESWYLSPENRPRIDFTRIEEFAPKRSGRSGWAGDFWNPTNNGW